MADTVDNRPVPPGPGEHPGQLTVGMGAHEGEPGGEQPGQEEKGTGAAGADDFRRDDEYSTADHGSGDEHGRGKRADGPLVVL